MKKNMGATDKAIRIIVAILFFVLFLSKMVVGIAAIILLVIAIVFLITSWVGVCPLYSLLGINSCKKQP